MRYYQSALNEAMKSLTSDASKSSNLSVFARSIRVLNEHSTKRRDQKLVN